MSSGLVSSLVRRSRPIAYVPEQGYVVIRNVANASELAHARELLWAFLEGAGVGAVRDRPETWIQSSPNQYGIVWEYGVGQSRLMWFLRTRPRLLRMFALVYLNTSSPPSTALTLTPALTLPLALTLTLG